MIESMRYQAEAEVRWLDHCETALARATTPQKAPSVEKPAQQSGQEVRR